MYSMPLQKGKPHTGSQRMTHKPRNFVIKALDALTVFRENFEQALKHHSEVTLSAFTPGSEKITTLSKDINYAEAIRDISTIQSVMKDSACWSLSDDALDMIWNTDFHVELFEEHLHLPFQAMALEYEFINEKIGLKAVPEGNEQGAQRVVTAWEAGGKFMFSVFFKSEILNKWFPSLYAVVMTAEEIVDTLRDWNESRPTIDEPRIYTVGLRPLISGIITSDEMLQETANANPCMDDIRVLLGLLQILRCSNAPVETVAAPEKLNKKRRKAGKTVIPQYSTLHITPHKSFSKKGHKNSGGPRATHWRRGHIHRWRTKAGYTSKWLPPQIINPKGKKPKIKPVVVI